MQILKFFLVAFFFLNLAILEFASAQIRRPVPRPGDHYRPLPGPRTMPIPRPTPGHPRRGVVVCEASDNGWEEHWSGHRSCGECLQAHGRCTERCSEKMEVCEVRGTTYNGSTITFRAAGRDRWDAEREARRQCEWNRDMRSCMTSRCTQESRLISSRQCR